MKGPAEKETMKSFLLLGLVLSMAVMAAYSWSYGINSVNGLYAALEGYLGIDTTADVAAYSSPAAYPVKAMVRGTDGLYCAQFNENGVGAVYEKTQQLWGRALSSVQTVKRATEEEYRAALTSPMLFFEYDGSVPLGLIAGWMGGSFPDNSLRAGGMLLSFQNGAYQFYLRDAATGALYSAPVRVGDAEFAAAVAGYAKNARLAVEMPSIYSSFLPETPAPEAPSSYEVLLSGKGPDFENGGVASMQSILEIFGYNAYTSEPRRYTENEVDVFVENYSTLRVNRESGSVRFSTTDLSSGIEIYKEGTLSGVNADMERVDKARLMMEQAAKALGVSSQAALSNWYYQAETGNYTAVFTARYGGTPVDDGLFARFDFHGNVLVSAELNLKQYTPTGERLYILPETQVAATVEGGPAGLTVRYQDSGDGRNEAVWKLYRRKE